MNLKKDIQVHTLMERLATNTFDFQTSSTANFCIFVLKTIENSTQASVSKGMLRAGRTLHVHSFTQRQVPKLNI